MNFQVVKMNIEILSKVILLGVFKNSDPTDIKELSTNLFAQGRL